MVRVYIDGFNFYYGCFKFGRFGAYRWMDLAEFARRLSPNDPVDHVRYFTAKVTPLPWDPDANKRQSVYLQALSSLSGVTVHLGTFSKKTKSFPLASMVQCPLYGAPASNVRVKVLHSEEKGSDVNLAAYLVRDACRNEFDTAIVVSNDSDLLEAVRIVRGELGKRVGVVMVKPKTVFANDADFRLKLRESHFKYSQLPPTVTLASGKVISKPATW